MIYLSRTKLEQFMRKPRGLRLKEAVGELKIPPFSGKIAVEGGGDVANQSAYNRLQEVRKYVINYGDLSEWSGNPDLRPGHWMQFDVDLLFGVVSAADARLLCFASTQPEGNRELFMYGSPGNVLTGASPKQDNAQDLTSSVDSLRNFLQLLGTDTREDITGDRKDTQAAVNTISTHLRSGLYAMARAEGWAEIVTVISATSGSSEIVVATPLYVRHAPR